MLLTKISHFYRLFREVFFCYHREHESEIHVDLKKANLSQNDSLHNLFTKCYLRGPLNTTFFRRF